MLAFPAAIRIYVAVQPVDMRKSFNGLWSAVNERLHEDPKWACLEKMDINSGGFDVVFGWLVFEGHR